jgi:hypothetical protein
MPVRGKSKGEERFFAALRMTARECARRGARLGMGVEDWRAGEEESELTSSKGLGTGKGARLPTVCRDSSGGRYEDKVWG